VWEQQPSSSVLQTTSWEVLHQEVSSTTGVPLSSDDDVVVLSPSTLAVPVLEHA